MDGKYAESAKKPHSQCHFACFLRGKRGVPHGAFLSPRAGNKKGKYVEMCGFFDLGRIIGWKICRISQKTAFTMSLCMFFKRKTGVPHGAFLSPRAGNKKGKYVEMCGFFDLGRIIGWKICRISQKTAFTMSLCMFFKRKTGVPHGAFLSPRAGNKKGKYVEMCGFFDLGRIIGWKICRISQKTAFTMSLCMFFKRENGGTTRCIFKP